MRKRLTTASNVNKLFNTDNTSNLTKTNAGKTTAAVSTIILEYNNGYNLLFSTINIRSVLSSSLIEKLPPNTCNNKTSKQQHINKSETIKTTIKKNCVLRFIKKIFSTVIIQFLFLLLLSSNILYSIKKTIKKIKTKSYIKFYQKRLFQFFIFYFCYLEKIIRKKIYNKKLNLIQKIRLKYLQQNKQQKNYQKYSLMSNNKCHLMAINLILILFILKCALIACDAFSIRDVIQDSGKRTSNIEVGK